MRVVKSKEKWLCVLHPMLVRKSNCLAYQGISEKTKKNKKKLRKTNSDPMSGAVSTSWWDENTLIKYQMQRLDSLCVTWKDS